MHFLRLFLCMNAFPEWESGGYSRFASMTICMKWNSISVIMWYSQPFSGNISDFEDYR